MSLQNMRLRDISSKFNFIHWTYKEYFFIGVDENIY